MPPPATTSGGSTYLVTGAASRPPNFTSNPASTSEATRIAEAAEGASDLRVELTLLRDAATVLTARQRLDGLLLQLIVDPFDPAACRGLRGYLTGPAAQAVAAHGRLTAATARGR